jgi:D-alanine-D-alanine ligase
MRVAVIRGGRSSEHPISLMSGEAVATGLREAGHDVEEILIERDGAWVHDGNPLSLTPAKGLLGCDAACPVLHGPGGEDGSVQGVLEVLDIPYVGSDVEASALCLNKLAFKRADIAEKGWRERVEGFGFPVWVKPARLGSSVGINKVATPEQLDPAIEVAARHDPKVIVEANGAGKEVECSVLGHAELTVSIPGEIVAHADWYDYEAKYAEGGMDLRVPAEISAAAAASLQELAQRVFRLMGCSGLARCDFFVDGEVVLVNELNTIPGFTATSVYGRLLEATGIPYSELCDRLVKLALERHAEVRSYEF